MARQYGKNANQEIFPRLPRLALRYRANRARTARRRSLGRTTFPHYSSRYPSATMIERNDRLTQPLKCGGPAPSRRCTTSDDTGLVAEECGVVVRNPDLRGHTWPAPNRTCKQPVGSPVAASWRKARSLKQPRGDCHRGQRAFRPASHVGSLHSNDWAPRRDGVPRAWPCGYTMPLAQLSWTIANEPEPHIPAIHGLGSKVSCSSSGRRRGVFMAPTIETRQFFFAETAASAATFAAKRDDRRRYQTALHRSISPEIGTRWHFSVLCHTQCHDQNLLPKQAVAGSSPVPRSQKTARLCGKLQEGRQLPGPLPCDVPRRAESAFERGAKLA
jgi:hypothetical protein